MGVFQFKQFSVRNERSSMKVNTDGVLLGAVMTLRPSDRRLLDIGTGTGVIALMAAQRLAEIRARLKSEDDGGAGADYNIIGIDIDYDSAMEAAENFAMSPWAEKLAAKHISLSDFEKEFDVASRAAVASCDAETVCTKKWYIPSDDENPEESRYGEIAVGKFDMIFSNPPYFESSLKSPDERKRTARHAETMSYREIIAFAANHLTPDGQSLTVPSTETDRAAGRLSLILPYETEREAGRLSLILPYETEREAVRYAASFNLRLFRRLRIRTTPSHPLSRVLLEFTREAANEVISEELTIQDGDGYTPAYRSLVSDFLLI